MPHSPVNGATLVKAQNPELKGAGKDLQPSSTTVISCHKERRAGPWEFGIGEELLAGGSRSRTLELIPLGLAPSGRYAAGLGVASSRWDDRADSGPIPP